MIEKAGYGSVPTNEPNKGLPPSAKPPKGFGARHTQALILFISVTVAFTMRAQLSVSMVAMVDTNVLKDRSIPHNLTSGNMDDVVNQTKHSGEIYFSRGKWSVHRTYDWNKSTQEMILFSFFVGYTSMMLPMGFIAQKFGGKLPIMVALAVNGVLSVLIPWLIIFGGWVALCACRLLQGMTQAAFYPSIHTILGKWAPLSERGRLSTYIYTGSQFGTIVIFPISGVFAGSPMLGWPATFWLCGILSFTSFIILGRLGASTPHEHPNISAEELAYIMADGSVDITSKKRRTPWKNILTSMAVWGLVASQAGSATGYLLVLTQIPSYMHAILGVEIKKNGLYSSMPYIAMYLMALLFGFLSDYMANKKIMSIVNIRRTANTIGMVMSGFFLIGFSYVNNTALAVVMLIMSLGLHSGVHVGFHINQIDLAPNFAGPIMALGNMVANLTSLLVPVIVSNIVRDDLGNQSRWQLVFIIVAAFQFITNTIFVIFVKGTLQPWNFSGEDENGNERDKKKLNEKNNSIKLQENATKA